MTSLAAAHQGLRSWIADHITATLTEGRPGDDTTLPAIAVHLVDIEPTVRAAGDANRPAPVVMRVRYLLCGHGDDVSASLGVLDGLLEAAVAHAGTSNAPDGLRVVADAVPPERWLALGVPPAPCLTATVEARVEPEPVAKPMVRQPLHVEDRPLRGLRGRVVGPGGLPLADAEVTVPATRARTRAARDGTFSFAAMPATDPIRISVTAGVRRFVVDVDPVDSVPGGELTIHCDFEES